MCCVSFFAEIAQRFLPCSKLPEPDFDNLRIILVDEKSIGPHHHYLTVVLNGETGEVLHGCISFLLISVKNFRVSHLILDRPT
jgi:hypothetical protein